MPSSTPPQTADLPRNGGVNRTDLFALVLVAFAIEAEWRERPWQVTVAALALALLGGALPMLKKLRVETPVGAAEAEPVRARDVEVVEAATESQRARIQE
jgi:hypothetical protein